MVGLRTEGVSVCYMEKGVSSSGSHCSEIVPDGVFMADQTVPWEQELPDYPTFTFDSEPLEGLLAQLDSDTLGLSSVALAFPQDGAAVSAEQAGEFAPIPRASAPRLPSAPSESGTSVVLPASTVSGEPSLSSAPSVTAGASSALF